MNSPWIEARDWRLGLELLSLDFVHIVADELGIKSIGSEEV